MLKIIESEPKIFFRKSTEPDNFFRNPFQRVIFEAAAGGIELSYAGFDTENAIAVGRDYSVGAQLAGVYHILIICQLFSHLITSFDLISENIISYFLFRCKTEVGNGEHSEQKHCGCGRQRDGVRSYRYLRKA